LRPSLGCLDKLDLHESDEQSDGDEGGNSLVLESEAAEWNWDVDDTSRFLWDEDTSTSHIGGDRCAMTLLCQHLARCSVVLPSYMLALMDFELLQGDGSVIPCDAFNI
jgi:hypothetical protein